MGHGKRWGADDLVGEAKRKRDEILAPSQGKAPTYEYQRNGLKLSPKSCPWLHEHLWLKSNFGMK